MPIFEYKCKICSNLYEGFRNEKCPKCNNEGEKILSLTNFNIKGSCTNPTNPPEPIIKEEKIVRNKVMSDWYCTKCEFIENDEFRYTDEIYNCPKCQTIMKQLMGKMTFELKYDPKKDLFDWQGNRSQYWSEVKKQRREGKDVKGAHEKD